MAPAKSGGALGAALAALLVAGAAVFVVGTGLPRLDRPLAGLLFALALAVAAWLARGLA